MLIDAERLQYWINNYYGYGSWDAKLWFVAHEESGGDLPEDVADKIDYFHRVHQGNKEPILCDIRDLYKSVSFRQPGPRSSLYPTLHDYRFGDVAVQHGFWKNLIAFAHAFNDEKMADIVKYQRKLFASPQLRNEAWIQLFPLPRPHNHAWYYSWVDLPGLAFIRNRSQYEDHVYENRISTLLRQMKTHRPKVVVMYGMNNIARLKRSVQDLFPSASFKTIKGTPREIPQHHLAHLDGTKLIITTQIPGLRHNRVESGFDWDKFGRFVADRP